MTSANELLPVISWQPARTNDRLKAILGRMSGPPAAVVARVAEIIERVRVEGDSALIALTRELDGVELTPATLRVSRARLEELAAGVAPEVRDALRVAHDGI